MNTTKIKIENLVPGQEVAIANCGSTARIVRRVAKNLYLVAWNGNEIEMRRSMLAVNVHGRWVHGAANATT